MPVTAVIIFGCLLKKIEATKARALLTFFDLDNGKWYENRPLNKEADRAIEYVYRNL